MGQLAQHLAEGHLVEGVGIGQQAQNLGEGWLICALGLGQHAKNFERASLFWVQKKSSVS